jgi:hypothetical protein
MAWKLEFDAPKGLRQMRGFDSITISHPEKNFWWFIGPDRWVDVNNKERPGKGEYEYSCSHHDVWRGAPKTVKAFLRYLRKRPELKGCEVWFVHRGVYYFGSEVVRLDVKAVWEDEA